MNVCYIRIYIYVYYVITFHIVLYIEDCFSSVNTYLLLFGLPIHLSVVGGPAQRNKLH